MLLWLRDSRGGNGHLDTFVDCMSLTIWSKLTLTDRLITKLHVLRPRVSSRLTFATRSFKDLEISPDNLNRYVFETVFGMNG